MGEYRYTGTELDLFSQARNWKRYLLDKLGPLIRGDVLELGSGIGTVTRTFHTGAASTWTCLEPDAELVRQHRDAMAGLGDSPEVRICTGALADLPGDERFDTILYVDVLEHIEADREELRRAGSHLRSGGRVVVLSPAHQGLYSPFDKAIGHCRRYNKASLRRAGGDLHCDAVYYLDAVGLLASLANRALLRQAMPTPSQIAFWDGKMIPLSRRIDPLLGYRLGKSIVGVWRAG